MSRPGTARLKVNPPLGRMPVLQFIPPSCWGLLGAGDGCIEVATVGKSRG